MENVNSHKHNTDSILKQLYSSKIPSVPFALLWEFIISQTLAFGIRTFQHSPLRLVSMLLSVIRLPQNQRHHLGILGMGGGFVPSFPCCNLPGICPVCLSCCRVLFHSSSHLSSACFNVCSSGAQVTQL